MFRYNKPFWDEILDMIGTSGFTAIEIPMVPDDFNSARSGAPICVGELNGKYGSPEGFLADLNYRGIDKVCSMSISAQSMWANMQDRGVPIEELYPELYAHAENVLDALSRVGGEALIVTPTPCIGDLNLAFGGDKSCFDKLAHECFETINKISKKSAEYGIRTYIRNDFWCLAHGDMADAFLAELDPSVGYAIDLAHLNISKVDALEKIKKFKDRIGFIRFSDTRYVDEINNFANRAPEYPQTGRFQRCFCDVGYGNVDLKGVYALLNELGYQGTVVLESKNTLDCPRGILRAKTFWNRLTTNKI
jgi:sugar phosphate isomerase/epimerase